MSCLPKEAGYVHWEHCFSAEPPAHSCSHEDTHEELISVIHVGHFQLRVFYDSIQQGQQRSTGHFSTPALYQTP